MKTVGFSDIGKRRSQNEDAFRFGSFDDGVAWAVVCDGMGGASGGQVASAFATDIVSQKIEKCYNRSMNGKSIENLLLSAITTANVTVFDKGVSDTSLSGMGTTIVSCIVKNGEACVAHAGDSRAYYISGDSIKQITKDHSLVQEMLDKGQITKEEFENHPNKNIITRALGVGENIDIDFDTVELSDGDMIVLCTDGLSGMVKDEKILETCKNADFNLLAETLVDEANKNGGNDNITVVVLKCINDELN